MRGTAIRIVFFGSDEFSLPILTALLDRGPSLAVPVNVAGVVTQPDRPGGRGRKLLTSPVKVEAAERQVPVLQPERLRRPEEIEPLAQLRPDLFVVASFGQLLRQRVLDLPTRGCLNLHPSLLPRYRGPAPIVAPILSGDAVTGTSVMQMELAMDAGPVVTQVSTPIEPEETAGELCSRLAQLSADLLLETLPGWLDGHLAAKPQDEAAATYTSMLTKEQARVDWNAPADMIARAVRAYNPWPVSHTTWEGSSVRIYRARPVPGSAPPGHAAGVERDALLVGTGAGLLAITQMQLAGGRSMAAGDVIRGRPAIAWAMFGN